MPSDLDPQVSELLCVKRESCYAKRNDLRSKSLRIATQLVAFAYPNRGIPCAFDRAVHSPAIQHVLNVCHALQRYEVTMAGVAITVENAKGKPGMSAALRFAATRAARPLQHQEIWTRPDQRRLYVELIVACKLALTELENIDNG